MCQLNFSFFQIITEESHDDHVREEASHPKPFAKESRSKQLEIVLKWFLDADSVKNVLNGTMTIQNITEHLEKMKFNGYTRLFDIDLSILKEYLTERSFTLLNAFKIRRKADSCICPQCTFHIEVYDTKWNCERCLFWWHGSCSQFKEVTNSDNNYKLCYGCFWEL